MKWNKAWNSRFLIDEFEADYPNAVDKLIIHALVTELSDGMREVFSLKNITHARIILLLAFTDYYDDCVDETVNYLRQHKRHLTRFFHAVAMGENDDWHDIIYNFSKPNGKKLGYLYHLSHNDRDLCTEFFRTTLKGFFFALEEATIHKTPPEAIASLTANLSIKEKDLLLSKNC